ncbi:MAG: serine protease, partial [Ignavibacteria bacterium]
RYLDGTRKAMNLFQNIANATVRIECGSSRGSGFHFLRPDIVVTNHHVVAAHAGSGVPARAVTEQGQVMNLTLLISSPTDEHDFAVFQVNGSLPEGRYALQPRIPDSFDRGTEIVFSGFPHGIPHLLVQSAIISGRVNDSVFYIDGSVNGGNSGGPIIDRSDGAVIGIVTQRRFLGAQDLRQLAETANQLRDHCQRIAQGGGSVQIMGIDFGGFSRLMAEAMLLIGETLEANANTGIGIGFSIAFIFDACQKQGITSGSS